MKKLTLLLENIITWIITTFWFSIYINYFDNNQFAFIGSIIVRLAGLGLFVYAIRYAISSGRSREMEIER
jgi:hypothetical protein